jgi:hypothetical protein
LREALNKNPLVQIGFIAVLGVGVVFLLMTNLKQEKKNPTDLTTAPPATGTAPAAPAPADAPAPTAPADPAAPTDPAEPAPTDTPATEFVPGPGLPGKVVTAYAKGDTVVILITRKEGIDDDVMRTTVNTFDGKDGVTLFDALARDIADYSRVTQGVDVDRVPAMIVLSPRKVSGDVPTASVSYGFRGPKSVEQAIADAGFEGEAVPYFPQ